MMERKFYTDHFEKMLKENADEYRMQPSKKVWHGLYNDLHPGRRWPSATMSIIFLFTLVIIGHLNTGKESRRKVEPTDIAMVSSTTVTPKTVKQVNRRSSLPQDQASLNNSANTNQHTDQIAANDDITDVNTVNNSSDANNPQLISSGNKNNNDNNNPSSVTLQPGNISHDNSTPVNNGTVNNKSSSALTQQINDGDNNRKDMDQPTTNKADMNVESKTVIDNSPVIINENKTVAEALNKKTPAANKSNNKELTEEEKQELLAAALKQKRREKISWTYYVTPSVSYRKLMERVAVPSGLSNSSMISQSSTIESSVDHSPFIGLELGSTINYKLSPRLVVKSGVQLNYSDYRIHANNTHPTLATLILNSPTTGNPYTRSAVSLHGNKTGTSEAILHNYIIAVAVPVGFEYEVGGNEALKLHLAASFQPSYVIKHQSYLLSTNRLNYLKDNSLLRHWNMSTNVGAFVAFESNSWKWQIGPQVHYQLKSTYFNNYPVREHLINYGIRIGVTKMLQ